jgi:hypothetical protein
MTVAVLLWLSIKYVRRCKLDRIYYFLMSSFVVVLKIKLFSNLTNLLDPDPTKFSFTTALRTLMIPLTYATIQSSVYLFIFELERIVLYVTCSSPILLNLKLQTWNLIRFAAISFRMYQCVIMVFWNLAD